MQRQIKLRSRWLLPFAFAVLLLSAPSTVHAATACSTTSDAGVPVITCDPSSLPDTSTHLDPGVLTIIDDPGLNFTQTLGGDVFGAGYSIEAGVNGLGLHLPRPAPGLPILIGHGSAAFFGKVFGQKVDLVSGHVTVTSGDTSIGTAKVALGGFNVFTQTFGIGATLIDKSFSTSLAGGEARFFVGFVPVKVRADIVATAKLGVSSALARRTFELDVTPGGSASLTASAAVDGVIISAGVKGKLNLIDLNVPIVATVRAQQAFLWSLKVDTTVTSLSGDLDAFARIDVLFFSKEATLNIAHFDGVTGTANLFNQSGVL